MQSSKHRDAPSSSTEPDYRFIRKLYGRGWTPATRQGWLVLLVYVVLLVGFIAYVQSHLDPALMRVAPWCVIILTVVLIGICYWTGEPPRWQWGRRKED